MSDVQDGPNAAYDRLLSDYTSYHVAFLVVGGLFTIAIGIFCAYSWVRFTRASTTGTRSWTFERKTYFSFGALSLVTGLMMAVLVAANVSNTVNPRAGLAGVIGPSGPPRAGVLAQAFTTWLQSGSANVPPLIQSKVDERLDWQRPKAAICGVLLVAFVALSVRLWSRLLTRAEARERSGHRLLLASGCVSVLACLLLMLMVIGNTQASFAPVTLTLLYG